MTGNVIFCVAEQARLITSKAIQPLAYDEYTTDLELFFVAELREPVGRMKQSLPEEGQEWHNEFLGATDVECQEWVQSRYDKGDRYLYTDPIAIADERSARDETLLVQVFLHEDPQYAYGEYHPEPTNKWYSWRIPYQWAPQFFVDFTERHPHPVYFTYFAAVADFTLPNGVLDMEKVRKAMGGEIDIGMDDNGRIFYRDDNGDICYRDDPKPAAVEDPKAAETGDIKAAEIQDLKAAETEESKATKTEDDVIGDKEFKDKLTLED